MQNYQNNSGEHFTKMRVANLLLQETGTYNPQYLRPYEASADGIKMNTIVNRVAEHGTAKISGALLAGAAGSMLAPTAWSGNEIQIANGWQEKRVRFTMELHCEFSMSHVIYYIQGYTNYSGITMSGAIDPNMVFTINSILGVNRVQRLTPMGMQTFDIVKESSQLLNDPFYGTGHGEHQYLMRPIDVFTGMHSNYIQSAMHITDNAKYIDNRATARQAPVRSSRSYNLPTNYMAKILDNYTQSMSMLDYGQSEQDALSTARELTTDSPIEENPFIRYISGIRGMGVVNNFTFSSLEQLDPNVHNVTNVLVIGQAQQIAGIHQAGSTEYWSGSNRETQVAAILSQAVPALMMDLMITKLVFRSTNHDIGGMVNTIIMEGKGLTTIDLSRHYDIFISRLEREVLFDITFGNQEAFMLDMNVDMFGETCIDLSLGSNPSTRFVVPSFCDHLTVPVMSGNIDQFNNLVSGFDSLVNHVADAVNRKNSVITYNPLV